MVADSTRKPTKRRITAILSGLVIAVAAWAAIPMSDIGSTFAARRKRSRH